jgi:hypothetical protein
MAERQQSVNAEDEKLSKSALAGQAGAVEGEAVEGAEGRNRDLLGAEKLARDRLDFFAGHGFDPGKNFV